MCLHLIVSLALAPSFARHEESCASLSFRSTISALWIAPAVTLRLQRQGQKENVSPFSTEVLLSMFRLTDPRELAGPSFSTQLLLPALHCAVALDGYPHGLRQLLGLCVQQDRVPVIIFDEEVGCLKSGTSRHFARKKSPPRAWQNCHLFVLPKVLYRRQRVACQAE